MFGSKRRAQQAQINQGFAAAIDELERRIDTANETNTKRAATTLAGINAIKTALAGISTQPSAPAHPVSEPAQTLHERADELRRLANHQAAVDDYADGRSLAPMPVQF